MHAPHLAWVLRLAFAGTPGVALVALTVSPSDGANARRLDKARKLAIAAAGSLQNPCWSPTGDRVAFTRWLARYNTGSAVVAIVPARGGPARSVSAIDSQSVNLPGSCWDRATDSIAYTADPEGADQVYLVAADASTRPRRVTTDPVVAFEPSLSPDGTQVVFENHQAGERGVIAIADVATGTVRQITSGADDRQPNWSPRGDLIAFQRTRGRAPDLYVVRPDGGGLRNVTKTKGLEETDVSFSPSGDWLVFSSDGDEVDVASLFTISINGRGRRRLTRTRGIYDGAPSWSPSGATIAFESARGDPDRSKGTAIWTITAPKGRR